VIERIEGMPEGAIGLRASGRLSKDDYVEQLEPALREGIATGRLRLVFQLTDFEGLEPGAYVEDMKTGVEAIVRDHSAWHRFALVTDVEWVAKGFHLFAWAIPGEMAVFELDELEAAKEWVAG
jgi:hypothetical protein